MPWAYTVTSTQRPEIGHAHAIGAGDKSMLSTCGRDGGPHHLPGVIDAIGLTETYTQRPEIGHAHAIGAGDKGMMSTCGGGGEPHHLPGVVDAIGVTVTSTQRPRSVSPLPLESTRYAWSCCAETGETKPSPIPRAAARIKLWILELG